MSDIHHYDGNGCVYPFCRQGCFVGGRDEHIRSELDQFGNETGVSIELSLREATINDHVLAFDKSALLQAFEEGSTSRLRRDGRIIRQKADTIDFPRLPCARGEWPRRCAAEK